MKAETRWAAVGALATTVAAAVAVISYAAPPDPSPPSPAPSQSSLITPPPSPTPPEPTAPQTTLTLTTPPVLPGGCADALAAIQHYNRTVGSTRTSEDAAAGQAYSDMMGATTETDRSDTHSVMLALSQDFSNQRAILEGMVDEDYSRAVARTNSDVRTLDSVCRSS